VFKYFALQLNLHFIEYMKLTSLRLPLCIVKLIYSLPRGLTCSFTDIRWLRLWVWLWLVAWMFVCCQCCVFLEVS